MKFSKISVQKICSHFLFYCRDFRRFCVSKKIFFFKILQKNISKFLQILKIEKNRAVATFSTIFGKYFKINFRRIF